MMKLLKNNYFAVKDNQKTHIGNHNLNDKEQKKIPSQLIISPSHTSLSYSLRYTVLTLGAQQTYYLILLVLLSPFYYPCSFIVISLLSLLSLVNKMATLLFAIKFLNASLS